MRCSNCNNIIPSDSKFCPFCGARIEFDADIGPKDVKPKIKKKSRSGAVFLIVLLVLIVAAAGAYYGLYSKSNSLALSGDFAKADSLLYLRSVTQLHDPEFVEYVDAGLLATSGDYAAAEERFQQLADKYYQDSASKAQWCKYCAAQQLFETKKLDAYKEFVELENSGYITAEELEKYRNALYYEGIQLYRDKKLSEARDLFLYIRSYRRSEDYITLMAASSYKKLSEMFGFENTNEIIARRFLDQYLEGNWKTLDGKYVFSNTRNSDGSGSSSTNLPDGNLYYQHFYFKNGIYYAVQDGNDKDTPLFRFDIISKNAVTVYCYADQQKYNLIRQ